MYVLIGAGSVVIAALLVFFMVLSLKRRINPLKRAAKQYDRGRFEKAMLLIAVELDKNPDNRVALLLRADNEVSLGRYDDAVRDYQFLIQVKKTGDGIDILQVKKRLLRPLYNIESLLELYTLCTEILKEEAACPEAQYYLSLLYIGQAYYDVASETLSSLVHNRPNMREAFFARGLSDVQRGRYAEAISSFDRCLEISTDNLGILCQAASHYFNGEYSACSDRLRKVPQRLEAFSDRKQYLFSLRLRAFCYYRMGRFDRAVHLLQLVCNMVTQKKPSKAVLYNNSGMVQKEEEAGKSSSLFDEYYRLLEVAAEQGKNVPPPRKPSGILDLKGLYRSTEAGLDLCFAMLREGTLEQARDLMADLRKQQPEVLGLKRLAQLIDEERERTISMRREAPHMLRSSSTERVIRGKGKGYKLWEYVEEWERRAVRPYELLIITGFTSRKMLSPGILLSKRRYGH